jgi:lysyl-tRNA synthetase class 2
LAAAKEAATGHEGAAAMSGIPWWRPESFASKRPYLERRAQILKDLRGWFDAEGFLEVETPALQVSPGLEPHLIAFSTELVRPEGERLQRYLHTSPEFAMKKLLVAGLPKIFQLAHVFRNGERASRHSPEFTMLEWYRAGSRYEDLMADGEAILRLACRAAGRDRLTWQGASADPFQPFERLSVAEAFRRHCDIDLLATAPDPAVPDLGLLANAASGIGIRPHDGDSWEDLFFRIMLERIEPHLGMGRPTILMEYPVSMAALARPKPEDGRVAERFELYACGVELANAFGELTDAATQRARFEADMDLKERLYGERYPIDEDFLAALAHGMPEAAGIALGIDRLVMLATGAGGIDEVLWAPVQ